MIDVHTKVHSFFIFNSNFGPKEGEELKRIIYFYPNQVSQEARKMQVGLCEAVVKFMKTFSSEPCEALQTQSKRYIFYQPEKDYWMVLVVRIPYSTKSVATVGDNPADVIHPTVMSNLLQSAYKMFNLFTGKFADASNEELYTKCENFFNPFIAQRNLSNDFADIIQGISYLPLDKTSFFKVMCFIDLVEINYPSFKCVMFLYNDQLIWNGLTMADTLTVYQYLVQNLLPEHVKRELQGGAVATAQKHGRYISPSDGIKTVEDLKSLPKVFLQCENDNQTKQYYFVIYRTLSVTVCFTVDVNETLQLDTFKCLDAFIGPQLSSIATVIGEQCAQQALQNCQTSSSDQPKFVYFNRLNLAIKSSQLTSKFTPNTAVKPEVLNIVAGIHADREGLGNYGELIIKTTDEYWITGKSSNDREFYVIIHQKNANLKEIADEVKRVCDAQMKGIFFHPT